MERPTFKDTNIPELLSTLALMEAIDVYFKKSSMQEKDSSYEIKKQ